MPVFILRLSFILLIPVSVLCQGQPLPTGNPVVPAFAQYRQQTLQEKLFVHTDQGFYLTGETMWFKVYYVDGTRHLPLDLSKVTYLELLDNEKKAVLQTKIALTTEGGNGTLFLPSSLNSGTYLLRAYTSWMKNFSPDFFFEKSLTIVNPFKPLGLPLLREPVDYDVQLFPEGGNLVQGLPGKVAFKVTDASGHGVAVRGWLVSEQNDTLARFGSHKFGMGTFSVPALEKATYRVVFRDGRGRTVSRPLPSAYAQGYILRLDDPGTDKLTLTVSTNVAGASSVFLFAHTRNETKVAESRPIQREVVFTIDKKALGDGISHLTVFNAEGKPVCERLYFKRPAQPLGITLKADQPSYAPRTKVSLDVALSTASQRRQAGLSMAVYRVDSLAETASESILSYLWMTSDLRGAIESPEYYLQPGNEVVDQATDNLMLTHGWRRFRWEDILAAKSPSAHSLLAKRPFIPEYKGLLIQGTVTDSLTGKPVPNIVTYLSSAGKPVRLYVSRSDSAGRIRFEMQDFYGARNIIVQTNPQDSLRKITIANPFSDMFSTTRLPALALPESRADKLLDRSVAMQVQTTFWGDRAIQYRYPRVDSSAFYGKPTESYLLDVYTRFPRMEEVLREYILGVMPRKKQGRFRLYVPNEPYRTIFEDPSLVLMDGVPLFDMDKVIEFSPLKVKQIDVITNHFFIGPALFSGVISMMTYKGDLAGFPLDARLLKLDYDGLQLQREFYSPRYETSRQLTSRLPDGRTLLYWNPNLKPDGQGKVHTEFYTSDQTGIYVVDVNGLTADGQAGSQRILFDVKNSPK